MTDQPILDLDDVRSNWQREIEGAYLYEKLAHRARQDRVRDALLEMSDEERVHASTWEAYLDSAGVTVRHPRPDLRIHMIVWIADLFGAERVLGLLIQDEVSDMNSYTSQARQSKQLTTYQKVIRDEAAHAERLAALQRPEGEGEGEPWHRGSDASQWLRAVVYGFNDGLTANFGLVMGVIGAHVSDQAVLLTGFAGLLADAFSMAASGFLAARSEQEVRQHHLALERSELKYMPGEERDELKGYYMQKGLTAEEAEKVADRLMEDPEEALAQLASEELGIDVEGGQTPLREGVLTGIATGLGAVIPIIPFFFWPGAIAVWIGILISMFAHFGVGASRAVFTGRPAVRSGFEMFLVGMGVALATYLLGSLLGVGL